MDSEPVPNIIGLTRQPYSAGHISPSIGTVRPHAPRLRSQTVSIARAAQVRVLSRDVPGQNYHANELERVGAADVRTGQLANEDLRLRSTEHERVVQTCRLARASKLPASSDTPSRLLSRRA